MRTLITVMMFVAVYGFVAAEEAKPAKPKDSRPAQDVAEVTATGTLKQDQDAQFPSLTSAGLTWELDLKDSAELKGAVEKLRGKKVVVTGVLRPLTDGEPNSRLMLDVTGIRVKEGFHVAADPNDGRLVATVEGETGILDIPRAEIGRVTVRRESPAWPKALLVRLHSKGMESFSIARSEELGVEWSASVSSTEGTSRCTVWRGRDETPVGPKSEFYTPVRIVSADPKIPLEDGYFEVRVPPKLLENNPQELKFHWVDFFRE